MQRRQFVKATGLGLAGFTVSQPSAEARVKRNAPVEMAQAGVPKTDALKETQQPNPP